MTAASFPLDRYAAWREAENIIAWACQHDVAAIAEMLESFCHALRRAHAHQCAQARPDPAGATWDLLLRLVQVMRRHGFALAEPTARDLVWDRAQALEVREFHHPNGFYRWPDAAPFCVVTRVRLVVQSPAVGDRGAFSRWRCLAKTAGPHPNVHPTSGAVCTGDLRGADLLDPVTLPTLLRNLKIPNLASAYFQVPISGVEPTGHPQGTDPIWRQ